MSEETDENLDQSPPPPAPKPLDASHPDRRQQHCGLDIALGNEEDTSAGTNSTGPKAKITEIEKTEE